MKHAGKFHWKIELTVECPDCRKTFDANDTDDFGEQLRGIHGLRASA